MEGDIYLLIFFEGQDIILVLQQDDTFDGRCVRERLRLRGVHVGPRELTVWLRLCRIEVAEPVGNVSPGLERQFPTLT